MKKFVVILLMNVLLIGVLCAQESHNIYVYGKSSNGISSAYGYWINGAFKEMSHIDSNESMIAVENGNVYSCRLVKEYNYNLGRYQYQIKVNKNGEYKWRYERDNRGYMSISSMAVLDGTVYVGILGDSQNILSNGGVVFSGAGSCMVADNGFLYYTKSGTEKNYVYGYYAGGNYYENSPHLPKNFKVNKMRVFGENLLMIGGDDYGPCIQVNDERRTYAKEGKGVYSVDYIAHKGSSFIFLLDNGELLSYNGNSFTNIMPSMYNPIAMDKDGGLLYILATKQQGAMKIFCVVTYDLQTKTFTNTQNLPGCAEAWQIIVD